MTGARQPFRLALALALTVAGVVAPTPVHAAPAFPAGGAAPLVVTAGELLRAAYAGDVPRIEALVAAGVDVNIADERGYTPLIWAAQQGQAAAVACLLARGAKLAATDHNGYTALIWAAQQGHVEVATRLLAAGAAIAPREKHGYAALDWATCQGHADMVKLLLAHGADPLANGPTGENALALARRAGRTAIAALLEARLPPAPHFNVSWQLLGRSALGAPIPVATVGTGPRTVLLIGTIHGDEAQGEDVIFRLLREIEKDPSLVAGKRLVAVPVANPDGKARHTRGNAHGVDLNRNFPTHWTASAPGRTFGGPYPLSEPESRLLLDLILKEHPALIVSFHADMRCNNFDGAAALPIARAMARLNGYRLLPDIGYPTPGSLGQQAAYAMGIPIITLEVGHEAPEPLYAKVRGSLKFALGAAPSI